VISSIEGESMSALPATTTPAPAKPDRISWPAYLGLGVAAAALGVVTAIGVWLFNQAFNAIHNLTFNSISGWAIALIPMVGGVIVALIMKYGSQPDKLAAMAHVIDGAAEHNGRLNTRNGFVSVLASTAGIGVGAPVAQIFPTPGLAPIAFVLVATTARLAGAFHTPLPARFGLHFRAAGGGCSSHAGHLYVAHPQK
jgi:H+/Cl- antiporter ClcA